MVLDIVTSPSRQFNGVDAREHETKSAARASKPIKTFPEESPVQFVVRARKSLGGFWLIQARSKDEAADRVKRCSIPFDGEMEITQVGDGESSGREAKPLPSAVDFLAVRTV